MSPLSPALTSRKLSFPEEEQQGEARAEYGKRLIYDLAQRLSTDYGKGFDRSNLWNMLLFERLALSRDKEGVLK